LDINIAAFKEKIREGLKKLVEGKYLFPKEGQFDFLSGAKKSIIEEVSSFRVREGDIKRKAKEFLKVILNKDRVLYKGIKWFDIKVFGDDEEIKTKGDIEFRAYSPVLVTRDETLEKDAVLQRSLTQENALKIFWPAESDDEINEKIKRLIQIEETKKVKEGRVKSSEEKEIMREIATEAQTLETSIETQMKNALLRGVGIFDGEEIEVDEKIKDISTLIEKAVNHAIPKVYTKFDMGAFKVNEKSIGEILKLPPNLLSEIERDVGLFDKNGELNRQIPAVEEILAEIKLRADKGVNTTGKDLISYFESVPYGWDPTFIRLIIAALFRDGAITLNFEGKAFRDFKKPEAQDLLINSRKFNRTKIDYEEEDIELTISKRQKVRAKLELLLDRKLDDSLSILSSAIEEGLGKLLDEKKHLTIRAEGADLPLYEEMQEAGEILSLPLEQGKPQRRVREFIGVMEKAEKIYQCQKKAKEFMESENLSEFKKLKSAKERIEASLIHLRPAEREEAKEYIEELNQLIENKNVIDKWQEFSENAQNLLALYRKVYTRLHEEVNSLYEGLKGKVQENPLYKGANLKPYLIKVEECICEGEPSWSEDLVVCSRCNQTIEGLKLKRESFERFREQLSKDILEEINAKEPGKKVASVSLKKAVKTKRIESDDDLDQAVGEFREAVEKHLEKGEIVALD